MQDEIKILKRENDMDMIGLKDLDIHAIGNTIQLVGAVYQGNGKTYLAILLGEDVEGAEVEVLKMDLHDWEAFLRQTDAVETEILQNDGLGIKKAIVRKTQRQIDSNLQWEVFRRDGYKCRYCGREGIPLTVDHIDLWEELGATIKENLLSCCKKCNRTRGNIQYEDWLKSLAYVERSKTLSQEDRLKNKLELQQLPYLRTLKVQHRRSR
jgi:hypothetical protein